MALTFDGNTNPVKITGDTAASVTIFDEKVFVRHLYWYDPSTANDKIVLTDLNGNEIFDFRAEVDDQSQFYTLDMYFDGLAVTDMDSGTLFIYIR